MTASPQRGFTLIELVVAISISAIVVGFMVMFIVTPVESYLAQARRAELVNSADMVANNITIDLRDALPNGVRYVRNNTIEVLEISAGPIAHPIAYLCDWGANTVRRYTGYLPVANLANTATDAALVGAGATTRALIGRDVLDCQIRYDPIDPLHNRLVGLRMQLTRNGETMFVFRQMRVGN